MKTPHFVPLPALILFPPGFRFDRRYCVFTFHSDRLDITGDLVFSLKISPANACSNFCDFFLQWYQLPFHFMVLDMLHSTFIAAYGHFSLNLGLFSLLHFHIGIDVGKRSLLLGHRVSLSFL